MRKTKDDIPELTREQLGAGVRGKYFSKYSKGRNVEVLNPDIVKTFPSSEAANKALASTFTFGEETQSPLVVKSAKISLRKAA